MVSAIGIYDSIIWYDIPGDMVSVSLVLLTCWVIDTGYSLRLGSSRI